MKVLTAGNKYLDIDGFASCVAYKLLLRELGEDVVFVSFGQKNSSICKFVENFGFDVDSYITQKDDVFVALDTSHAESLSEIVSLDKIVEVIDHHTGYEEYWKERLGEKCQIEFIGAAATLVVERFDKANKLELLRNNSNLCKLLMCAILDNTINFRSSIVTQRDFDAYKMLQRFSNAEADFAEKYFTSCEEKIRKDIVKAISEDVKVKDKKQSPCVDNCPKDYVPEIFGQLLVYNKYMCFDNLDLIKKYFEDYSPEGWLLNLICLKDGKSYLVCSESYKDKLKEIFNEIKQEKDYYVLDKFLLRKQIVKFAKEKVDEKK